MSAADTKTGSRAIPSAGPDMKHLLDQDIVDRYAVTGYGPAYQVRNNGRTLWLGGEITLF